MIVFREVGIVRWKGPIVQMYVITFAVGAGF